MQKLLEPEKTFALLKRYSVPYADWKLVKNAGSASKAAKKLGFPVAMKMVSKKVVHKSDVGGVKVNIADEEGAGRAFDELMAAARKLKAKPEGVLVQGMKTGVEVIIGMKRDAQFGPVVLFGLGGIFVEVLKDVSMRIAPLSKNDCIEMIDEIKGSAVLKGARGRKPVNIDSLVKIIIAVSRIGEKNKAVSEMDLNPVMVNEKSASVVDARIIVEK
jgi:acetyl-CoA synthetase (ADP-forming)